MKRRRGYILLIALILYFPLGLLQVSIDYQKQVENLEGNLLLMPGQAAGDLVLGGFRGLAADLLWLNMETYFHSGQYFKILPLLESVAWLQPHYVLVWAIGGWHMAYNVLDMVKTKQEKDYWYHQGVEFEKRGITYNPDKYDLYFELGWLFYNKGRDYPSAVQYLSQAVNFPHPDYVDDVLAHAYEMAGQKQKAIAQWESIIKRGSGFKPIAIRMIHDLKTKGWATPKPPKRWYPAWPPRKVPLDWPLD